MANSAADTIYVTLFAGTLIMLVLSCTLILFIVFYHRRNLRRQADLYALEANHQREMLDGVLQAVENERRRFAQDLHDEIGGALSALRMQLSRLTGTPAAVELQEIAGTGKEVIDSAVQSVRRIAYDMLPPGLEVFGIGYAAGELCKRTETVTRISINYNGDADFQLKDKTKELMLYRILQELLSNAVKHSGASEIDIRLGTIENGVELYYADNGAGFNAAESKAGLGLLNMESRVQVLAGKLHVNSAPGKGTKITVQLPIL
ncbi:MAG: sensor histidine kinase [Bacteroidia bacterium]